MRGGGCPRRHTSAWKTLLRLQRDPVSTSLMGQAQLVAASIRPGNRSHELLGRHQVAGHSCCTVVVSCEQALIAWQKYKFSATHALGLSLLLVYGDVVVPVGGWPTHPCMSSFL